MRRSVLVFAVALTLFGCAGRGILPDTESREALKFFSSAADAVSFPLASSFSGVVNTGSDGYPFVVGVRSDNTASETVGVYDPLGHVVMMLSNDGAVVAAETGPAAGALALANGRRLLAGAISFGRILSGAPGYVVGKGEIRKTEDGGWQFSDGRQTLRTDPGRRFLASGTYSPAGRSFAVSYPGRDNAAIPPAVHVEAFGSRIDLRRDME